LKILKKIRGNYFLKLFLYLLFLCLVPVLVYALIASSMAYKNAKQQISERADVQTEAILTAFDGINKEYDGLIGQLADDPAVRLFVLYGQTDADKIKHGGTTLLTQNALYVLYDVTNGKSDELAAHIVSASQPAGVTTKTIPRHYLYPFNHDFGIFTILQRGSETVLRVNDHNANNLPDISYSMARPVLSANGEPMGYVIFDIYNSVCSELLSRYPLEQGGQIFLVDSNNFILYTNAKGYDRTRSALLPPEYRSEAEDSEKVVHHSDKDSYGIRVVTVTPFTSAESASSYVADGAVLAGIVSAVLCILISLFIWKDISEPLSKLTEGVKKVESGNFSAHVDLGKRDDEFGRLGNSFNEMTREIQALIANIEEKQKSLRIAETSALQAQINPHFLYNTLDLIKWNCKLGNTEEATKITVLLGKLLRAMADFSGDVVPVEEELEIVRQYLSIQQIHYGEKLKVDVDVEEDILTERIPKLILQPLVENAIVHGVDSRKEICLVQLRGRRDGSHLVFEIEDNGPGMDEKTRDEILSGVASSRRGIGTGNVRKRAMLYGDVSCGLKVESIQGEGSLFILTLKPMKAENSIGGANV